MDKQNVSSALLLLVSCCDDAHSSIQHSLSSGPAPDPVVLHKDLISILSLLRASTTKVALALKPSSPTYRAAISPLNDVSLQVSALLHCVNLFEPTMGATFLQEITSLSQSVFRSVKALSQSLLDNINQTRTSDDYLIRIGEVHDVIDKACAPSGLSRTNLESVKKRLKADHDSLDDALKEVAEMINDAQDAYGQDANDENDDAWAELGISSNKELNPQELDRTKKAHSIVRLSTLLHKHVLEKTLSLPSATSSSSSPDHLQCLDALPSHSAALAIASDEFITTLYGPQDTVEISEQLTPYLDTIYSLLSSAQAFLRSSEQSMLENDMRALALSPTQHPPDKMWFDACSEQISKAADILKTTLHNEDS